VRNPFTGNKIPLRDVFSIYAVFMIAVAVRYAWLFVVVLRNGPPKTELEIVLEEMEAAEAGEDGKTDEEETK
jgi:C4-dicarboxylate transporter DctQ subunit